MTNTDTEALNDSHENGSAVTTGIVAPSRPRHAKHFVYYDLFMAAFVTVLVCCNFFAPDKRAAIGGFSFGIGVLFYPITYLLSDILTEVYGFARARRVIWVGFAALFFATLMNWIVVHSPPASGWPRQTLLVAVFENSPRVVLATFVSFFIGEYANSATLARLKVLTSGQYLWFRTIGSTVVGQAADSIAFYPIAFLGIPGWSYADVLSIMLVNFSLKVLWETLATPATYRIIKLVKAAEDEDHYDRDTDFTPFSIRVS